MKVLMVNSYDINGGAARATYRLYKALMNFDVDLHMIVQKKFSNDENVIVCEDGWDDKAFFYDNMPLLSYPHKSSTLFSVSAVPNKKLIKFINSSDVDIVHLHWITNGFLSIEDIAKIEKPIVWSLHDNWAFTGGCHILWECDKYKEKCGACPRLGSTNQNDLSAQVWRRKQKAFAQKKGMIIVGISRWLNECSKSSSLLKDNKHINLPNPIDTNVFKPLDKEKARQLWRLPRDKKLVLFGANSATSDINKGFMELSEALYKLTCKDVELVVFGNSEPQVSHDFGFKTYYFGHLYDDMSLVALYSACDVMVVPSLQEAFGQTALEAMACSTPTVAFGSTGLLDLVDHLKNGYLAKPFDTTDLANGIEWVLHAENYDELCHNAREKVVREFDSIIVGKKYIELYEEILEVEKQDSILQYRPDHRLKFITKEIEDWFLELATKNLNYVVYGHGSFGEAILDYLGEKVIAFVDQKSNLISTEITKGEVYNPNNLLNMEYEKIIISVLGRESEIERYLVDDIGISKEKIVRLML